MSKEKPSCDKSSESGSFVTGSSSRAYCPNDSNESEMTFIDPKSDIAGADTTRQTSGSKQMSSSEAFGSLGFILALIAVCLFIVALISLPNYPLKNGVFRPALLAGSAITIGAVAWLCIHKANKALIRHEQQNNS